jgi:hypothetical protein
MIDVYIAKQPTVSVDVGGEFYNIGGTSPEISEKDFGKLLYVNNSGQQDFLAIGNGLSVKDKKMEVEIENISNEKIIELLGNLQ